MCYRTVIKGVLKDLFRYGDVWMDGFGNFSRDVEILEVKVIFWLEKQKMRSIWMVREINFKSVLMGGKVK